MKTLRRTFDNLSSAFVIALALWPVSWFLWDPGYCDIVWMCHYNNFMSSNWLWVVVGIIGFGILGKDKKS